MLTYITTFMCNDNYNENLVVWIVICEYKIFFGSAANFKNLICRYNIVTICLTKYIKFKFSRSIFYHNFETYLESQMIKNIT